MTGKTEIEWADATWNPTKGCDRVSPGCDHCYALTMAKRLKGMGSAEYQQDGDPRTSGPGFLAHESPAALDWPLTKKEPLRIFVNSMSDLFHANISDEFIARVFAVKALAPQHTFQLLTKRHARMRSLLNQPVFRQQIGLEIDRLEASGHCVPDSVERGGWWPLRNVWGGVSVESQQWARPRIEALRDTPFAVRFLSCEPLLGPVDLTPWIDGIDWVIVGGESGPGARPMHPDWARALRDQCVAAGVPFLFKQWGAWAPGMLDVKRAVGIDFGGLALKDFNLDESQGHTFVTRVGKKRAGRELDGRTWDEYPAVAQ